MKIVPFEKRPKPKLRMLMARDLYGLDFTAPEKRAENIVTLICRVTGKSREEVEVMSVAEFTWYGCELNKMLEATFG